MEMKQWFQHALHLVGHAGGQRQESDLREFQLVAARRIAMMAQTYGVALEADATGLGKTRTCAMAAILVRNQARSKHPIVLVVPHRVAGMWRATLEHLNVHKENFRVMSHTDLSRGKPLPKACVVVVDEAHRFKNPEAIRTKTLVRGLGDTPLVLATATPVINSIWDLYHLLEIGMSDTACVRVCGRGLRRAFEEAEAGAFDLTQLLQAVSVRRVTPDDPTLRRPKARIEILRYDPDPDENWLWQNLGRELDRLNFAIFRNDWPKGLMVEHIRRLWEGGAECLLNFVEYILTFHERWIELRAQGRELGRHEFEACFGPTHQQNAFAFMFEAAQPQIGDSDLSLVKEDLEVWKDLHARLNRLSQARTGLEAALCGLLSSRPEPLLIFTSFQKAAERLYQCICEFLGGQARVALITGTTAVATGLGRTNPGELLERFAPRAHGREIEPHQQIQVLVCTDCLSEGVNLQDCGRMVLGDLPYTPQGIEQRIGRICRPGSMFGEVEVWLPRPHSWNDSLGLRTRLNTKIDAAETAGTPFQTVGTRRAKQTELPALAAMTRLDELAARFGRESNLENQHWEVDGPEDELWAVVEYMDGELSWRRLVYFRDGNEATLVNALEKIPRLVESAQTLIPAEPPEWFERWLEREEDRLNGAVLAPANLDARQTEIWRLIRNMCDAEEVADLRQRVLQPLSRAELEGLVGAKDPVAAVRGLKARPARRIRLVHAGSVASNPQTKTSKPAIQASSPTSKACATPHL